MDSDYLFGNCLLRPAIEFERLGQNRAKLSSNSSGGRSWALKPGTSSTQLIHQSPSRFRIAVYNPIASKR